MSQAPHSGAPASTAGWAKAPNPPIPTDGHSPVFLTAQRGGCCPLKLTLAQGTFPLRWPLEGLLGVVGFPPFQASELRLPGPRPNAVPVPSRPLAEPHSNTLGGPPLAHI